MSLRLVLLSGLAMVAGGIIAIQGVLMAGLGQRIGALASLLVITLISAVVLTPLVIAFPSFSNLVRSPPISQWYMYVGGILGILILMIVMFLIPRIGAASTFIALVLGQSLLALLMDHFGFLGLAKTEIDVSRLLGLVLVTLGAYLVGK